MKIFLDGLIFGRQRRGGISRMWEEYLMRLPELGVAVQLLVPWRRDNDSLKRILSRPDRFPGIQNDFFYWPTRVFERSEVRSILLDHLYIDNTIDVFQSTYFSTSHKKTVKKVVVVHDMILELHTCEFQGTWARFGIANKKKAIENADAIIAISHVTRQDILRVYPFVPDEKITIIPLAVSPTRVDGRIAFPEMTARHGSTVAPGEYFLYVGNRDGYKNFSLLPQLLPVLKDKRVLFVCIGGENPRVERRRLGEMGLAGQFIFIDQAGDDELQAWYRNARALVFPSRCEGFGLPLLEAMANDCPVLCADTAIFHEIGGDAPVYFDPDSPQSLAQALDGLAGCDRLEMIRKGRLNVGRFSWDDSARALAQLYQSQGAGA